MTSKELKLGIIGLSEGNGHPYSWSAIFNGYSEKLINNCPFPAIPAYLKEQNFPEAQIKGAHVSHIWCQEASLARHIAACSNIPIVVQEFGEMIGEIDALLLARDDARNHLVFATPFLNAGLPVYIDKPLALSIAEAKQLLALEQYPGQIFTCSALAFSHELILSEKQKKALGKIIHIDAYIPKQWETYGIHLIEPTLNILKPTGKLEQTRAIHSDERTFLSAKWSSGETASFHTLGYVSASPCLRVMGSHGTIDLVFYDTFQAFKRALQYFINIYHKKVKALSSQHFIDCITLVEAGMKHE